MRRRTQWKGNTWQLEFDVLVARGRECGVSVCGVSIFLSCLFSVRAWGILLVLPRSRTVVPLDVPLVGWREG